MFVVPGVNSSGIRKCPEGFYCPLGTGWNWKRCPRGTYSNEKGLISERDCKPCPGGKYCDGFNLTAPTGNCSAGYYCVSGVDTIYPALTNLTHCPAAFHHLSIGGKCPPGHFCPAGSHTFHACPPGTFANNEGFSSCIICPAGYYCPNATANYAMYPCPTGHFCPEGTKSQFENPCPPGTFNDKERMQNITACLPCTSGHFCQGYGNSKPTNSCDPGWYCPQGQSSSKPASFICKARHYCPRGSSVMQVCKAGMYCDVDGLSYPKADCRRGYYCPNGSLSATEIICPSGNYCGNRSSIPIPCPDGTYLPSTGNYRVEQCLNCTAGKACTTTGLSAPNADCSSTFYCPPGQKTASPSSFICPKGHYCKVGYPEPRRCENGTYQENVGQSSCVTCLKGYFCDNTVTAVTSLAGRECPAGYFCPPGTRYPNEYGCYGGTWSNRTGLNHSSECDPCPVRYFCQQRGLSSPEGLCLAGYYCNGSASRPDPPHLKCPLGHYCPIGSASPLACPRGSFAKSLGNKNVSDCKPCSPGKWCDPNAGPIVEEKDCNAGYVCVLGSTTPTPSNLTGGGYICPKGHYCTVGAHKETKCDPGYFAPIVGLGSCFLCTEGRTCPEYGTVLPSPCSSGHYCGNGTKSVNGTDCPVGTYQPEINKIRLSDCLPCPPGKYCKDAGKAAPTADCDAGYLCKSGAKIASPNDGVNGPCPVGHYCEAGTTNATKCPPGTVRKFVGAKAVNDCYPCDPGRFCEEPGLSSASGLCAQGFYCPEMVKIVNSQPSLYPCPKGHFCKNGTSVPTGCPPGQYQHSAGLWYCLPCPSGKFCQGSTSIPAPCPAYSYCGNATIAPTPCPNGTYTKDNITGLSESTQCEPCPAGRFCQLGRIAGNCSAGHLCYRGSPIPSPTNGLNGIRCPIGYYCPAGALSKVKCPKGLVIDKEGSRSILDCQLCPGGFFCTDENTVPQPCERGYFCPYNSTRGKCRVGTYNNVTKAKDESYCKTCPKGYWCRLEGTADYTQNPCPVGHYCHAGILTPEPCPAGTFRNSSGAGSIQDCYACPAGYYCPQNRSTALIPCMNGTYCPNGTITPDWCLAGYYCPDAKLRIPCESGFYCPNATEQKIPCPPGHYCSGNDNCTLSGGGAVFPTICPLGYKEKGGALRHNFSDTCEICRPGYYGAAPDRSNCTLCRAGVICTQGATTDQPTLNGTAHSFNTTKAYPCPPGYYCKAGDLLPRPCPVGGYNPDNYAVGLFNCTPCAVDHFNHLTAQSACFPCGAQANQLQQGRDTCTCTGLHKVFLPSDRTCRCPQGYEEISERDGTCVKKIFELCTGGLSRTQDGQCLDDAAWKTRCEQTCGDSYNGFDKSLGLCLCSGRELEQVCDRDCRLKQRLRMSFICRDPTVLVITDANANKVEFPYARLTSIPNFASVFSKDKCTNLDGKEYPVRITDVSGIGFTGVYDPNADILMQIMNQNARPAETNSTNTSNSNPSVSRKRRSLLAVSTPAPPQFNGIKNPTVCLAHGEQMIFTVTKEFFPQYDKDNLYNTNPNFDYGAFNDLSERHRLMNTSSTLFAFLFNEAGVYAMRMSTTSNARMYVRVMAKGAQCAEDGPFFPTTPRIIVQNGIAINRDILIVPDWLLIGIMLGCFLLVIMLLALALVLFRKYGWQKLMFLHPRYRKVATKCNFDDYSSKGSAVHPIKKYHRQKMIMDGYEAMAALPAITEGDEGHVPASGQLTVAGDVEVQGDEFWDYDQQIDLEAFSTKEFYTTLSKQSSEITAALARQKDQVKQLYQKIHGQTESLKGLWIAKLNLKGRSSLATQEDLQDFEIKKVELEEELERRKELGFQFLQVLKQQHEIMTNEESSRETHQVNFMASVRETMRILKNFQESRSKDGADYEEEFDEHLQHRIGSRVDAILQSLTLELTSESQRRGTWGLLGQYSGAVLLDKNGDAVPREALLNPDGSVADTSMVELDLKTGLLIPNANELSMMLPDGMTVNIPPKFFVHPVTTRALPIEGNVAYDPVSSRLVFSTDSPNGEASNSPEVLIPFIPYPLNPDTGLPAQTQLTPLEKRGDMKLNGPMVDPYTGLTVPILGMTIHPETGNAYPVGGCHSDPVTGLPIPLESGSVSIDHNLNTPVPILGVTIDPFTGKVIPVAGHMLEEPHKAILLYGSFTDPLSNKAMKTTSSRVADFAEWEVDALAGGHRALLDVNELYYESRVLDSLRDFKDALTGPDRSSGRHEENIFETSMKELAKSRSRVKTRLLIDEHDIQRREERATVLSENGGSPGMYEFISTGQLLPILVGTDMKDPSGSGLDVPILSVEKDRENGNLFPLGGSVEDPHGEGLVPIMIGEKTVDPLTEQMSSIVGVRFNYEIAISEPITASTSQRQRKRRPPPGSVQLLEEELAGRRSYWRRQRHREDEVTATEAGLVKDLMDDENLTAQMVKDRLDSISDGSNALVAATKREIQRRGDIAIDHASALPPDVVAILTQCDGDERQREDEHHSLHSKLLETIGRFFSKLQMEESKYRTRIEELENAHNFDAQEAVTERYRTVKQRLRTELEDQLQSRMESLDQQHETLEYTREKAELCAIEAKSLLSAADYHAGDYDAKLPGAYGDNIVTTESGRELIPILQKLIKAIEASGPVHGQIGSRFVDGSQHRPSAITFSANQDAPRQQGAVLAGLGQAIPFSMAQGQPLTMHGGLTVETNLASANAGYFEAPGAMLTAPESRAELSADEILARVEVAKLGEASASQRIDIRDIIEAGELTEEKRKEISKAIMEKHIMESVKLETELRSTEIKTINNVLEEYDEKKEVLINEMKAELKQRLSSVESEEEREQIILEYAQKMEKATRRLQDEKEIKMKDARARLKEERLKRKRSLYRRHMEEARAAGVGDVVDLEVPSEDDLDKELLRLTVEQEKLRAELRKAYEEESEKERENNREAMDKEMEARARAMNLNFVPSLQEELEEQDMDNSKRRKNLKDKLMERRSKRRHKSGLDTTGMTPEEEKAALLALEAEDAADQLMETSAIISVLEEADAQRRLGTFNKAVLNADISEEEKQEIVNKYMEEAKEAEEKFNKMHEYSRAALAAKLAARRRLREEKQKQESMKTVMDALSSKQVDLTGGDDAAAIREIASVESNAEQNAEEKALLAEQEQRQIDLEMKKFEEQKELEESLEEEQKFAENSINSQLEEQKKKALETQRQKFEQELEQKKKELNEEQLSILMDEHNKQMEFLEKNMETEKQRQVASLADKIAERKKKKAAAIARRKDAEMAKELAKQQEERNELENKHVKDVQHEALANKVQETDPETTENLIYRVLQQRHVRERVKLEDQFAREVETAREELRTDVLESREQEREELVGKQEQEFMELIASAASLSSADLTQKKAEMKLAHKKQLVQFDKKTKEKVTEAEKEGMPSIEVKHAHARLELRERQLEELAGNMRELTTKEDLIKQYAEQAEKAAQAAKEFREKTMFDIAAKINAIKEEKRQKTDEQKRKMEEEIRRLELELDDEKERDALREAEREADREASRRKKLQEKQQAELLAMAQRDVDEKEKEKIMKEHEENIARFEENLKREHERTKEALKQKLEQRRQKKKELELAKIKDAYAKDIETTEREGRQKMATLQTEGAKDLITSAPVRPRTPPKASELSTSSTPSIPFGDQGQMPVLTAGLPEGVSEQDWLRLLLGSSLFDTVNEIEDILKNGSGDNGVAGAKGARPYIDIQDAQWMCKGDLIPVDINDLSPSNFVVYRYGVFLTELLRYSMQVPEITLLLASCLPPNNYEKNAFRNSFFYERARKILFIRQERMESVGDFVVVIIHCLAHIKVDELINDGNPLFLREFYKGLRICCQDMFFARSRSTPSTQSLTAAVNDGTVSNPIETAFRYTQNTSDKLNVVSELLNVKVRTPVEQDFADENITERMSKYNTFINNAKLRAYLRSVAGVGATEQDDSFVQRRILELRGDAPKALTVPKPQYKRTSSSRSVLLRPRELLETQMKDLQGRVDNLNAELGTVLKNASELSINIQKLEAQNVSKDLLDRRRAQWRDNELRKDNILKKVKSLEAELRRKERELEKIEE